MPGLFEGEDKVAFYRRKEEIKNELRPLVEELDTEVKLDLLHAGTEEDGLETLRTEVALSPSSLDAYVLDSLALYKTAHELGLLNSNLE